VALRLFRDRGRALASHKDGVAALYEIDFTKDLKFLKKRLLLPPGMKGPAKVFGGIRTIQQRLYDRVVRDLFSRDIRSEARFLSHAESTAPGILRAGDDLLARIMEVLTAHQETLAVVSGLEMSNRLNVGVLGFLEKIREELGGLAPETFLEIYDADRLRHLPRYIRALGMRARRALVDFEKDRAKAERVRPFTEGLNRMIQGLSPAVTEAKKNAVEDFFWLIEEFKVSVFAQELKTAAPVSEKRLRDKQREIERMA
ncbi:MAG: DUF3418 domain-containing protein, partial [Desulfobacterales bacterium]|nr:DUF3418 domain-containing protein [Desulfobacterales bacterium]